MGGPFFSSISEDPSKQPKNPMNNDSLHTKFQVLRRVVASTAGAELEGLFHYGKNYNTTEHHTQRAQTSTNSNTYRSCQLHYETKIQINGNEVLLGKVSNTSRTLLHLLGPRNNQQSGFFYQKSSSKPSHTNEALIHPQRLSRSQLYPSVKVY